MENLTETIVEKLEQTKIHLEELKTNQTRCVECNLINLKLAGTILENFFGWESPIHDSELPMHLGCTESCWAQDR